MLTDLFFFVPFATTVGIFLIYWLEDRERAPAPGAGRGPSETAPRRRTPLPKG